MDRLTELFANKPTSYTGLGLAYVGDTRGNAVVSGEQSLEVVSRMQPEPGGSTFKGAWSPSIVDGTTVNLTGGTIFDGVYTWVPNVTGISVTANAVNYLYLHVTFSPTYVDGYVTGGGLSSATVEAYTSTRSNTNSDGYILLAQVEMSTSTITRYHWYSFGSQLRNSGVGNVIFNYW